MNLHTPHLQATPESRHQASAAMSRVLARMPPEIGTSLTAEQLEALDKALDFNNPVSHPVNLRVTLFGRFYLVVIAGPERRSPERRAQERKRHPLYLWGNIALLTGIAILGVTFGYTLRTLILEG
jgi:hypothetical protein